MAEKMDLNALHEILAQTQPLREPDSLYMTEATREKIKAAVEPMLVAKSEVPGVHFGGMEILCYPAGTVVFNTKTNQRAVIDEHSVLSAIRADIVIVEPTGRAALEQNNG